MARKLRLSVRKNDERKKRRNIRRSLVVSIQRDSIAIMTVSLSTKHYLSAPVPSLSVLKRRLSFTIDIKYTCI